MGRHLDVSAAAGIHAHGAGDHYLDWSEDPIVGCPTQRCRYSGQQMSRRIHRDAQRRSPDYSLTRNDVRPRGHASCDATLPRLEPTIAVGGNTLGADDTVSIVGAQAIRASSTQRRASTQAG